MLAQATGSVCSVKVCSTLSLTSVLGRGGWSMACTVCFIPGRRPSIHCRGGWLGLQASLEWVQKIMSIVAAANLCALGGDSGVTL